MRHSIIFIKGLLFIIVFAVLADPALCIDNDRISIGLRAQDWFFMWRDGRSLSQSVQLNRSEVLRWKTSEENLKRFQELNAEWNLIIVVQDQDDNERFKRVRSAIAFYKQCGIRPVLRVIENPSIYMELYDSEDITFGYSERYYQWIKRLAEEFQNDIRCFLIGNEVDADLSLNINGELKKNNKIRNITYAQYKKVLYTAYKAIKDVNRDIQVGNHGASGFALALSVADDLVRAGKDEDAAAFWDHFTFNRYGVKWSQNRLKHLLRSKELSRRINIVKQSFKDPHSCDYIQLHYYGGWRAFDTILNWVDLQNGKGGRQRQIIATEIGYELPRKTGTNKSLPDMHRYAEDDHAIHMVKNFMLLLSHEVLQIEYWQVRSNNNRAIPAPLYHATEEPLAFNPVKAEKAFRTIGKYLNGATMKKITRNEGLFINHFQKGDTNVFIIWSDANRFIELEPYDEEYELLDMYGSSIRTDFSRLIRVGPQPVYIVSNSPISVRMSSRNSRLPASAMKRTIFDCQWRGSVAVDG